MEGNKKNSIVRLFKLLDNISDRLKEGSHNDGKQYRIDKLIHVKQTGINNYNDNADEANDISPFGKKIYFHDFKNIVSLKEYIISGMEQKEQDNFFN